MDAVARVVRCVSSRWLACLLTLALLGGLGAPLSAAILYELEDLGTTFIPQDVSPTHEMAGWTSAHPLGQATLRHPDGRLQSLGSLPGLHSGGGTFATASRHGVVVGYVRGSLLLGRPQAWRWTPATGMQALPGLMIHLPASGPVVTSAQAVNSAGVIAGMSQAIDLGRFGHGPQRAVVWVDGHPLDLGTLGGPNGSAHAINEHGAVVGTSQTAAGPSHATLWHADGTIRSLDTLGSAASVALALNDAGTVVGHRQAPLGEMRAFVWTASGGMQLLPFLGDNGLDNKAVGVTEAGVMLGHEYLPDGSTRVVRWDAGQPRDLQTLINAPGWVLDEVTGVSPQGLLVGLGRLNGRSRAFQLTPLGASESAPAGAVVRGDFNGDGQADQAWLASDMTIWVALAGQAARSIPGRLASLVAGDLNGDGRADLAGLAWDQSIWVSTDLTSFWSLPGRLTAVVAGDFAGFGYDQLAGLAWNQTIWYAATLHDAWQQIPGFLVTLDTEEGTPDVLVGMAADGSWWRGEPFGLWQQMVAPLARGAQGRN